MNVRQGEPLGLATPFCVHDPPLVTTHLSWCCRRCDRRCQRRPAALQPCSHDARFNETGRSQVLAKRMPGDPLNTPSFRPKNRWIAKVKSAHRRIYRKTGSAADAGLRHHGVGRYVLSADIWPELERTQPVHGGVFS